VAMTVGMYVKVPEPLAESLAEDGFREVGPERGIELYVNDAAMLVGTAANLVTVLVGRHEISRFVRHLWASARGHKPIRQEGMTVVLQRGSQRVAITLQHEGFDGEEPPRTVVHGMSALLEALADPDADLPSDKS
jgi:hypothetical protein